MFNSIVDMLPISDSVRFLPESIIGPTTVGAIKAAKPLKDCAKFNLLVAVSGGPKMVIYGFAAVSKNVNPQAITNKAPKK